MLHRTTAFTETMPLVLLMLLLLLATSSQSTFERSDPLYGISAECSPKEPLLASGSTMELNCTLRNATPGVTAHLVHCLFDRANLTVVVLDDNTFQIRRENVTRHMSQGHVFCHLNVMGKPEQLAQIAIRVADIPVAPNITGCVVNNWVEMICTWELPKQETGLQTNYTLGWTVLFSTGDWSACPIHLGNDTCKWINLGHDSFKMDMEYQMKTIAKNELKTVYSQKFRFHTSDLVKPNPVDNLHSNTIRSHSVDLSWTWGGDNHDDQSRTLLYRVNYTSEWENKSMETTSKNATLSSLVPHTNYRISVECIPYNSNNRRGFWSKETFINLVTKEDVPGRAPALADGSYSSLPNGPGKYEVFWQPVPKRWLHGTLQQYRIRCFNSSRVLAEYFEKHGTRSELSVPDGKDDISVTVEAETMEGYNNSLDLITLVIPRAGQAPAKPGIVHAVRNQSEITAMWSSVSNASGYTVYWCKKGRVHCESPLNWTSVSPDVTSLPILIGGTKHDDFLIAVSVETYVAAQQQNVSSGMAWAGCVPDISKSVKPPEFVDFSKDQQAFNLSVEWLKPKCEETAYIVKFEILYCQRQSCGEDACCNNKSMFVENDKTKAVITNLVADVEYEVSMRSISFTENSTVTDPIRRTVLRSGLTAGVIAAIVIAALVLFLLLVVGLVTIAKKIKKWFHCCEKIKIVSPPTAIRMPRQSEQTESNQVQYFTDGRNIQIQAEEQKSLLHDGTATKQETDAWTGAVIIRRNGEDYRHPNMSKPVQPHVGNNGVHLLGHDELTDSGISSYTHLAVPDESAHTATHKEPNSLVESGHVTNSSSDHASHVLPRIATDNPLSQTLDVVEPPVSDNAVTEPYMPVEKIPLPVVGSASSSTITPYTTVEQTVEMAELKNFPESRGYLPADTNGDAVRQVETPAVDCHNAKPDEYQQVQGAIDDYISGSLAGVSNVQGEPRITTVNSAEFTTEDKPLYANHETPKSEDGYSDQRDIAGGTSSLEPLLPVGYIPLAPTLST